MPWYNLKDKRKRARPNWKGVSARNAVTWGLFYCDPLGWGSRPPAGANRRSAAVAIRFVSASHLQTL